MKTEQCIVLRGRGVGPSVEGVALVSQHGFSARYDLDRSSGIVSRKDHDLFGQSVADRILVFPTAKGGVATAWALFAMRAQGVAPRGLVFDSTNPIMVQGAVLADIPLMAFLEPPPSRVIQTGDLVRLVPAEGILEIRRAGGGS